MKEDNAIFKLIGPVLVKQERIEAEENVKKRIEFITGEMRVCLSFHVAGDAGRNSS